VSLATPRNPPRIDDHIGAGGPDTLAADVRAGLASDPRELSPKYLYDARGSELFDRITTLAEYYPTRCERAILNRHAPELVDGMEELVELGSGMASKTRALLYALAASGTLRRFVPFDVDESVVRLCAEELQELYPGLAVHGVVGDFEHDLRHIPAGERRLFALLGGTVGNLHPDQRAGLLGDLAGLMGPSDRLLLGCDLIKDRALLEAAYDDAEGVTAAFNLNLLTVLNNALDADFEPSAYAHGGVFDEINSWLDMRLRARRAQHVRIAGAGIELDLAAGEEIRTEISTKFTPERIRDELEHAGLAFEALYTDDEGLFSVTAARGRCAPGKVETDH
jgi:L-histidine N-alpha-methyltransferase